MIRGSSTIRLILVLALLASAVSACASIVLDQYSLPNNLGLNDSLEWQQQITVGIGGQLAGITLYTNTTPDTDTVRIGVGPAPFTGAYSFTTTAHILNGGTFIDASSANIFLNPGDLFTIDVLDGPGCCNLAGSVIPYSGGDLYLYNNGVFSDYTQQFGYSLGLPDLYDCEHGARARQLTVARHRSVGTGGRAAAQDQPVVASQFFLDQPTCKKITRSGGAPGASVPEEIWLPHRDDDFGRSARVR